MIRTDEDLMIARHTWRLIGERAAIDGQTAPRAGGEASTMQNQVTGKAPVAVPVPTETTGLTEVEALTFKNDHQTGRKWANVK
jgi:hypothetical protein